MAALRSGIDNHEEFTLSAEETAQAHKEEEKAAEVDSLGREGAEWARKQAQWEQFRDAVDRWHEGAGEELELHQYLGLTREQYAGILEKREIPANWQPPSEIQGEGEPA